ncbi:MAG TPA: hypothetical protein VF216_13550 [Mizugakiibacter sp.]
MDTLTRDEVFEIVGELDDAILLDLIATGATYGELLEACVWLNSDDAMGEALEHPPQGRVAELCDILSRMDWPDERD